MVPLQESSFGGTIAVGSMAEQPSQEITDEVDEIRQSIGRMPLKGGHYVAYST